MTTSNSNVGRGIVKGTILAWVATTSAYVIGNLGAPIRVITGWAPDGADLSVAEYLITSAVAVAAGGALLWAMQRHGDDRFRLWTAIVSAVAVVSTVPLWGLDVDTGSKLSLTLMHLLTGAAAVVGQSVERNSATVRSNDSAEAAAS
jgi:hypothetical protein